MHFVFKYFTPQVSAKVSTFSPGQVSRNRTSSWTGGGVRAKPSSKDGAPDKMMSWHVRVYPPSPRAWGSVQARTGVSWHTTCLECMMRRITNHDMYIRVATLGKTGIQAFCPPPSPYNLPSPPPPKMLYFNYWFSTYGALLNEWKSINDCKWMKIARNKLLQIDKQTSCAKQENTFPPPLRFKNSGFDKFRSK